MPLPPPAGHHGTQEGSRGGPAQGSGGAGAPHHPLREAHPSQEGEDRVEGVAALGPGGAGLPHHPLREAHPSQEGEDKVKIECVLEAMNWRIREEHL